MPPVRHHAMCLYVLGGFSVKEIAEFLGIAQSTVRGHLKTARGILSKEVGPAFPGAKDDGPGTTTRRERG